MPKKTREEKILARLHRLEQNQAVLNTSEPIKEAPNAPKETKGSGFSLKNLPQVEKSVPVPTIKSEVIDYSYVKKDLKKVFILTIAALAIEVSLSLTASTWYAKLFSRLF